MLTFIASVIIIKKKVGVNAPINCFVSDQLIVGFTNGWLHHHDVYIVKDFSRGLITFYCGIVR